MERMIKMEKAKEILEKMENARSWKEAEVTMEEVKEVLTDFVGGKSVESNDAENRRLKSKVDRLTESNKQLMAENKRLKGGK